MLASRTCGPIKILILANESSFWKIGGLFQLDRLLLNINETFKGENRGPENLFIFWRGEEEYFFKHPSLAKIEPRMSDKTKSLMDWIEADQKPVLLLSTNLLLGRGSLDYLCDPSALLAMEPGRLIETPEDNLWDVLAKKLDRPGTPGDLQCFYERIDSPSDIAASERRLFSTLSKPTDGLISTCLNRPLSTRLSRLLAKTPVTPNHWTLLLLGVALFGVWFLTWGNQVGFILGTFFFQVVSALDGCDGELARVRFQESEQGEWIDTLADLSGNILFLFALGLGLSRQEGISPLLSSLYFWEGTVTALALVATLWGVHRFTQRRESAGHFNNFGKNIIAEMSLPGWLKRLSLFIARVLKRDTYTLIFFIMAVSGESEWILHLMGIGITVHAALLILSSAPEQSG